MIAIAALSDNPHEYAAHPFVISGTCKREDSEEHAEVLQLAINTVRTHLRTLGGRLYGVSSDGESRRCKSLGLLTMCYELSPSSAIYSLLGPLPLFNRLVGADDLVCDKDWRHVIKRFRNTLLHNSTPLRINGSTLTRPLIKRHLVEALSMSSSTADSLLSPNDPQDVVLAFRLLNSISTLPPAPAYSTPIYESTRNTLRLLGRIYTHLLKCYTELTLSLREQLEHLSAVAHILLTLYMQDKRGIIPAILYLDVQIMIKNVYFCVAKILVDNPDSGFLWIICLGTDALEKIFGLVRTMIGSDANADQLQLTSRMSGAIQCSQIHQEHPEWDRGPRRLAIPSLQGQGDHVASSADHVNPRSWVGDVSVKGILSQTCWIRGRQSAESDLAEFGIVAFSSNIATGSTTPTRDMLRPFGDGKLVYLSGLRVGDVVEEHPDPVRVTSTTSGVAGTAASTVAASGSVDSDTSSLEPDLEDLLGADDVDGWAPQADSSGAPTITRKVEAWLPVDNKPGSKAQHKSTFLRLLSQHPDSFTSLGPGSTNRLSRVCGFTRYTNSQVILDEDAEVGQPTLGFDDPAITLMRVDGLLFLAIVQICDIKCAGQSTCSLKVEDLALDNVRVRFEILSLRPIAPTPENREANWEWTGRFVSFRASSTREVEGRAIQPIDPQLVSNLISRTTSRTSASTYQFRTFELRALACELFKAGLSDVVWAEVPRIDTFPYRTESGTHVSSLSTLSRAVILTWLFAADALCFLCEMEDTSTSTNPGKCDMCPLCPDVLLSSRQQNVALNHIAAHIIHDTTRVDPLSNPCGFCLSAGDTCAIYLKKSRGARGGFSIDMHRSRCPRKYKLINSVASASTARSPSSNVPLPCPLCPNGAQAVWKYNLPHHLHRIHKADPERFASLWRVTDQERTWLKALRQATPRKTKRKRKQAKAAQTATCISEAHTCKMAIRCVLTCFAYSVVPSTYTFVIIALVIYKSTHLNRPRQPRPRSLVMPLCQCSQAQIWARI